MGFKYLGKALAAISQISVDKVDAAAAKIHQMPWGQVSSLNGRLDLGWLRFNIAQKHLTPGGGSDAEQRAELADYRRGGMLLQELTNQAVTADYDNAKSIIRNTDLPAATYTGAYLKASAWAFASQSECQTLTSKWDEGAAMAGIARITAGAAHYANDSKCKALVKKWFGDGEPLDVIRVLDNVLIGVGSKLCGICYEGHGVSEMASWRVKLKEDGPQSITTVVNYNLQDYGWSAPKSASHQAIGFSHKFFDQHCLVSMRQPHVTETIKMNVSRGGAMLHEMTHRFAGTEDVTVPDTLKPKILSRLAAAGVTVRTVATKLLGYCPIVCSVLASDEPALAMKNADSYRLFGEDAFYTKPF